LQEGGVADDINPNLPLNEITTLWTVVRQAHAGDAGVNQAQRLLLERYCGAVYRYLLASVRDRDVADELFQEFALRFVRGDFRNASPERGRFRDFVKTAVFHLIVDWQNRRAKQRPVQLQEVPEVADQGTVPSEREFIESWRSEILSRTWQALEADSRASDQAYYRVLRFRADHPDQPSADLATQLSAEMGRAVTADWVRQTLRRARDRFADLLLDELAASLEDATPDRLEQELIDLELLSYCQQALDQRRGK
jgi:RNA polymerase sigma-70 factor (ECF subfamily)